jgi:hypothetical protein
VLRDPVAEFCGAALGKDQVEPAQDRAVLGDEYVEGADARLLLGQQGTVPLGEPIQMTRRGRLSFRRVRSALVQPRTNPLPVHRQTAVWLQLGVTTDQ